MGAMPDRQRMRVDPLLQGGEERGLGLLEVGEPSDVAVPLGGDHPVNARAPTGLVPASSCAFAGGHDPASADRRDDRVGHIGNPGRGVCVHENQDNLCLAGGDDSGIGGTQKVCGGGVDQDSFGVR